MKKITLYGQTLIWGLAWLAVCILLHKWIPYPWGMLGSTLVGAISVTHRK